MKKILLLGGSPQQVVAIKVAKELGYYTVLCDYLPNNPGQYEADKFYNKSTTDVDAVFRIAKEEKVDGILAYASDPAALPAAIVSEKLGLPTNPSQSVAILGVKHLFRKFLQENDFACPKNFTFSPDVDINEFCKSLDTLKFPIIIKPTDSSGSKGVTKILNKDNIKEAISWADRFSRNKILIAEEFIERGYPEVIGGDIFVWDGKVILFGEMSCLRDFDGKGLIPIGKKKPTGLNLYQIGQVHRELQRLVNSLNVKFGELNIEIIVDKEDNVHFLELGPRAGGNMIPIQLSDAFGVDLVKANVLAAMGKYPELNPIEQPGCYMHYVLHSYEEGILERIEFGEPLKKYIYRTVLYKNQGDSIEYFDGAGKALGIIFLHFDCVEQMNKICKNINLYIKIIFK